MSSASLESDATTDAFSGPHGRGRPINAKDIDRERKDEKKNWEYKSRGQSLVEAAVTLPFILLLALGVTDIGRAFYYREAVTNATRQAPRVAASPTQQEGQRPEIAPQIDKL